MKKRSLFAWVGVLCLSLSAGGVLAQQDQPKKDKPAAEPAKPAAKPTTPPAGQPAAAGQPSPEEMAMMAAGPEHAAMKPLVGNWACDVSFTMIPGAPPEKSSGTVKREMILDGRYLSENFDGTAMGMPFKGQGLLAYDRLQKQYESNWIDIMGTGMFHQVGKGTDGGKKITFEGENFDPMQGKKVWSKSTLEITSNDKNVMKMFTKGPDGKEFQNFEMTCTRK